MHHRTGQVTRRAPTLKALAALAIIMAAIVPARAQVVVNSGDTLTVPPDINQQVELNENSTLEVLSGGTVNTATGNTVVNDTGGAVTTVTVRNAGEISADSGTAIFINESALTLINSGLIRGANTGVLRGTFVFDEQLTIINSGTIIGGNAGIETSANPGFFTLNNSGTIRGSSFGLDGNGSIDLLYNSGTIEATGGSGIAITFSNIAENIVNSGHIVGVNRGINAFLLKNVTNSGTIIGGDFAIIEDTQGFPRETDTVLTLLPGSNIQGAIDLGDGPNTLNVGNGLSITNTFVSAGVSKVPVIGSTGGAPYAISGDVIVVADPTNLAAQDEHLADLTGGISSALRNRLSGQRNGIAETVSASAGIETATLADSGHPLWIQGFGSWRRQEASGAAVDTRQWLGGFVVGADGPLHDDVRAGLFGGASRGGIEADYDSQDTDSQSFFAGLYASVLTTGLAFDLAVTGGYSDFDQDRRVANNLVAGGIETATADFDGWFISPELTATRHTWLMGHPLEASLVLRYAGLFLDGYTEEGVTAPLTVDDRTIHIGVARLQLAAPNQVSRPDGSVLRYQMKAGAEGRTNFGGNTVDGALLGQNISFDPGGEDETLGAFAGLSGEYDTGGALVFNAGAEGLIETSGSYQISGKIGAKIRF